jgi:cardiolipin synthase
LQRLRGASEPAARSTLSLPAQVAQERTSGSPLVAGNDVTLLSDGPATDDAMLEAIHNARALILLETYILEDDEIGARFAAALLERRAAGVTVALMVDAIGSAATPESYFDTLRAAGVQFVRFNPLNPFVAGLGWSLNQRDHRKVLVVDGTVGFTGGLNLSEVYSSRPGSSAARRRVQEGKEAPWRDTHVRIRGPAALDLQRAFIDNWTLQGGDPIDMARLVEANRAAARGQPGTDLVRVIPTGPDENSSIYWTLLSAIARAQKTVHITMAYFVPNRDFLDGLEDAARRGVDVELVLPGYSDFWMVFHAGRARYTELLESNVQIFERRDALLHAKTAVIDGVWSTVGSSNLDWRSFFLNYELNAVVLGPAFGQQMERLFDNDRRASVPVTLEEWRQRGWRDVFLERFSLLFAYWL